MEKKTVTAGTVCHLPNLCTVIKQEMISDECLVCNQDTVSYDLCSAVCVGLI